MCGDVRWRAKGSAAGARGRREGAAGEAGATSAPRACEDSSMMLLVEAVPRYGMLNAKTRQ